MNNTKNIPNDDHELDGTRKVNIIDYIAISVKWSKFILMNFPFS